MLTVAAILDDDSGSSLMTVLRLIDEMSRNCSLSEHMFVHKWSTIVSTCSSFTFVTNGPRLK